MSGSLIHGRYVIASVSASGEARVIADGAVVQRDSEIVDVGPYRELQSRHVVDEELGSSDHAVIPGLVNAHHHVAVTPFQLGTPDLPLELWALARFGNKQPDLYLETLFGAMQMVESGITTAVHLLPLQRLRPDGLLEDARLVLRAYDEVGMRVAYGPPMRDQNRLVHGDEVFFPRLPRDLAQRVRRWIGEITVSVEGYVTMLAALHDECAGRERVRILAAPTNVQWCSDRLLAAAKALADSRGLGLHIHVQESLYQKEYALRTFGKTPLAHLADLGVLGSRTSICHGVWLTQDDMELVRRTGTMISTQASSNLRLKSGIAAVNDFLARGLAPAIGLDEGGINDDRDMLQEMRLVATLHRVPGLEARCPTSAEVLGMATANGARVAQYGDRVGALEAGRRADLVLINLTRLMEPYLDERVSIVDALLHRAKGADVDTVMIEGRLVMRDRSFPHLDRAAVVSQLRDSLAGDPTAAQLERRRLADELMLYVKTFYRDWGTADRRPISLYNSAV